MEEFLLIEVLLSASKDDKTKVQIFQEKKKFCCVHILKRTVKSNSTPAIMATV